MSVSFEIKGLDRLAKITKNLPDAGNKAMAKAWRRSGEHIKYYILYHMNKGTRDNPSAPGEFPHRITGELAGSLGYTVQSQYSLLFYASAPHARFLEDGTGKMEARPYLRPAMEASTVYIEKVIIQEIKRSILK